MPLRFKIILLVSGAVTILTIVMFAVLSRLSKQQMDLTVRQNMETANSVVGKFVEEHGRKLLNEASLIESFTISRSSIQVGNHEIVQDLSEGWRKRLGADAILILGQKGQVLALDKMGTNSSAPRKDGFSARHALEGESVFRLVKDGGRLRITAGVPVMIGGVPWGAICVSEDVDSTVAKAVASEAGSRVAFEVNGQLVGIEGSIVGPGPISSESPTEVRIDGVSYVALRGRLPQKLATVDIGIVTFQPMESLIGPYRSFQRALLFTMLTAFLMAIVMAILVARGLSRPLEGIVGAARTVCSGEWPEPFDTKRQDEIGVLQSAFDQMTASVRAGQEKLLSLLDTDVLTELANHRSFLERLDQETARCQSSGDDLSVLLVDIDRFQEFNKSQGHGTGDRLLKRIAECLEERLPEFSIAGRYGGEEFGVILPRMNLDQAEELAESLRAFIAAELSKEFGTFVTVSVGCAEFVENGAHSSGLILASELAVAQAKELGRNRVCRFDGVAGEGEGTGSLELRSFLAEGSFATIQALAAAVDAKDHYTQGHSVRVADYASSLASAIGLPDDEVELIRVTGTLHDVGKIGVPDAILQKSGRLTDEERQVMETHPVLGEVIVRKAPALAPTLPGVRGHHERWDGQGYPDGLAGEQIGLMSRILALADTFDAMTSDRPYRKGLAIDVALSEIEKNAGTQFDPSLAPMFVRMMGERFREKAA